MRATRSRARHPDRLRAPRPPRGWISTQESHGTLVTGSGSSSEPGPVGRAPVVEAVGRVDDEIKIGVGVALESDGLRSYAAPLAAPAGAGWATAAAIGAAAAAAARVGCRNADAASPAVPAASVGADKFSKITSAPQSVTPAIAATAIPPQRVCR